MDVKQYLIEMLKGSETDADDNQSVEVSRRDLRQAMLDIAAEQGFATNHTPIPKPIALNDDEALARRALGN